MISVLMQTKNNNKEKIYIRTIAIHGKTNKSVRGFWSIRSTWTRAREACACRARQVVDRVLLQLWNASNTKVFKTSRGSRCPLTPSVSNSGCSPSLGETDYSLGSLGAPRSSDYTNARRCWLSVQRGAIQQSGCTGRQDTATCWPSGWLPYITLSKWSAQPFLSVELMLRV